MQTRAAVVRELNQLTIETVELDALKASEVLVRVRAAGVKITVDEAIAYALKEFGQ